MLKIKNLLVVGAVLGIAAAAQAVNYTWTGASNNNWDNGNNWTTEGIDDNTYPDGTGDNALFPSGGSPFTVTSSGLAGSISVGTITVSRQTTFNYMPPTQAVTMEINALAIFSSNLSATIGTLNVNNGGTAQFDAYPSTDIDVVDIDSGALLQLNAAADFKVDNLFTVDFNGTLLATANAVFDGALAPSLVMNGLVDANGVDLVFENGVVASDSGNTTNRPKYKARSGGNVQFEIADPASQLECDIDVDGSSIMTLVNTAIVTGGSFIQADCDRIILSGTGSLDTSDQDCN